MATRAAITLNNETSPVLKTTPENPDHQNVSKGERSSMGGAIGLEGGLIIYNITITIKEKKRLSVINTRL